MIVIVFTLALVANAEFAFAAGAAAVEPGNPLRGVKCGNIESGRQSHRASASVPGVRARVAPGCDLGQSAEVMGPAFRMAGALLDVR